MAWLLVISALLTSALSAVFGMAGGLLLMGIATAALPVAAAMVFHGVTQLASNGFRAALLWRHVHARGLLLYALGAGVAFAVLWQVRYVPNATVVLLVLGALPFLTRLLPVAPDFARPRSALAAGFLVGGLQLIAGVAGPLLDLFFVETRLDRREVVATKAATQVLSHSLKIVYFAPMIADGAVPAPLLAGAAAAALVGTVAGGRLLERISDSAFRSWTRRIVLAIGGIYLVRGLVGCF